VFLENTPYVSTRIRYASGLRLFREDGGELLDGISGTFNLPLGYNHPEVVRAVQDQVARVTHLSSDLVAPHSQDLIDRLVGWAPEGIDTGWVRDLTGSTAIECAVKIAQKYTGASDIISLFFSHHGQTHFSTAISGMSMRRRGFPGTLTGISVRVPAPYCYRCFYAATHPDCGFLCVDRIQSFIEHSSNGSVACMIVEPILGNGGNIVPPPGYFESLQELCRKRDILLIADEVQTGIGRTGHMFASETLGLRPDIMVLAKGLGGIGVPIAAVLMRSELNLLEKYQHSFTSGSNMLGLAAAHATLDVVSRPGFLAQVRLKGQLLGELLHQLAQQFACVAETRGMGMMWGLEIIDAEGRPDPAKTRAIVELAAQKYCLLLRSSGYGTGNVVKVRPALIATEGDLREIVDRLSQTLADLR
jgi:4-aminobutyrate aminotransferase-like enzyme